mgnify:CR=1 FL=1
MRLKTRILLFLFLSFSGTLYSQDSVNLAFFSPKAEYEQLDKGKNDKSTIINKLFIYTPKEYRKNNTKYPLVYLLHGWAGSSYDWKVNYDIQKLADLYKMIIVLPDGYYDSWYVNSNDRKELQYESAFWKRVVPYIESKYRVDEKNRFITGLSMGGHGAISFYLKKDGYFKAAGSMSGILDITKFSGKWGIKKRLGDYAKNKKVWEKNSAIHLLKNFKGKKENLKIFIACGKKDFAFGVNSSFAKEAASRKVPILNLADSGDHNWEYWTTHVEKQILFFSLVSQNKSMKDIKKILKL